MSVGAVTAAGALARTVPPARTPVSKADLRAAIGRAYQSVIGKPPTTTLLDNLTAQASLETGQGASMYNFNFGGIKGASPSGATAQCMTHEVVDGATITVKQGFRAYGTLDEGAQDYVRVLSKTFGAALGQAEHADAGGFAHALKQAGYYTASESDYTAALRSQGAPTAGGANAAPTTPTFETFFDSARLSRICTAISESALRIGASSSDSSSG